MMMKKTLVYTALLAITIIPSTASAENFFVGLNMGYADASVSDSDVIYGIEAGTHWGPNHRFTFGYSDQDLGKIDIDVFNIDYDYLIPVGERFNLSVGAHTGYTSWETKDFDSDGLNYGAQIGAEFWLTKSIALGAEYRYSFTDAEDHGVELEDTDSFTANIAYHF
ncbi:outer membrane beta-barrel protein [Vibrio owensii]|uniref:outer membrane beta-barrel protein n=1 Tax=Vibrio owensii TaxID=696485 RepID=UPI003DA06DFD